MKRIAIASVTCMICFLGGCMVDDQYDDTPALSSQLKGLSYLLSVETSCMEKANTLDAWLKQNDNSLQNNAESFNRSCLNGERFRCMSSLILASGSVEVALKPCLNTETLMQQIERLNQIAGTAVGKSVNQRRRSF